MSQQLVAHCHIKNLSQYIYTQINIFLLILDFQWMLCNTLFFYIPLSNIDEFKECALHNHSAIIIPKKINNFTITLKYLMHIQIIPIVTKTLFIPVCFSWSFTEIDTEFDCYVTFVTF